MAAFMGRTEIGVKKFGEDVDVPEHPVAKLMYYFHCICTCVEATSDSSLRRFQRYRDYRSLTNEEEAQLLVLCLALSPDKLIGSLFFPADDLDGSLNEFFQLSAVSTKLVVAESVLIGGQQKRVHKIMMFNELWMDIFYIDPIRSFESRHRQALPSPQPHPPPARQSNDDSSSCIIS